MRKKFMVTHACSVKAVHITPAMAMELVGRVTPVAVANAAVIVITIVFIVVSRTIATGVVAVAAAVLISFLPESLS
jgi:hypothetical protein